jgi:hypothetical protein
MQHGMVQAIAEFCFALAFVTRLLRGGSVWRGKCASGMGNIK